MKEPAILSIAIDSELLSNVRAAAAWRQLSVDAFINTVLTRASDADLALAESIQEAVDSLDRGEGYTQDEVEAWFEARHGQAAAE